MSPVDFNNEFWRTSTLCLYICMRRGYGLLSATKLNQAVILITDSYQCLKVSFLLRPRCSIFFDHVILCMQQNLANHTLSCTKLCLNVPGEPKGCSTSEIPNICHLRSLFGQEPSFLLWRWLVVVEGTSTTYGTGIEPLTLETPQSSCRQETDAEGIRN